MKTGKMSLVLVVALVAGLGMMLFLTYQGGEVLAESNTPEYVFEVQAWVYYFGDWVIWLPKIEIEGTLDGSPFEVVYMTFKAGDQLESAPVMSFTTTGLTPINVTVNGWMWTIPLPPPNNGLVKDYQTAWNVPNCFGFYADNGGQLNTFPKIGEVCVTPLRPTVYLPFIRG